MIKSYYRIERFQGGTDRSESNTHFLGTIQPETTMTIRISIETDRHPDIHHQGIITPTPRVAILTHSTPQKAHRLEDHKDTLQFISITISQIYIGLNLTTIVGGDLSVYLS